MFTSPAFLIPAAGILSIQLAVIVLLYNISHIRMATPASVGSSRLAIFTSRVVTALLPIAVVIAVIGDVAALKAYHDYDQKQTAKEARAIEYEPLIRAAISAKPNLWCLPNGYLITEDVSPISKRPCAQVGQFRVMDQYASMVSTVEIYKVFEDGSVRPAAYQREYDIGFIADEKVTTLAELKTAFGLQ